MWTSANMLACSRCVVIVYHANLTRERVINLKFCSCIRGKAIRIGERCAVQPKELAWQLSFPNWGFL